MWSTPDSWLRGYESNRSRRSGLTTPHSLGACSLPLPDANRVKDFAWERAGGSETGCRWRKSSGWGNAVRSSRASRPSLNNDEGIVLDFTHAAVMIFEIPATGGQVAGRNRPRSMAVRQEFRPRASGTAKSLDKAQRAENRNHPAFLNLDQRQQMGTCEMERKREL